MLRQQIKTAFLVSLLFYGVSILIGKAFLLLNEQEPDTEQIEKFVHEKLFSLDNALNLVERSYSNSDTLQQILFRYEQTEQIYFAIYRNWNLKIWPTERIVLPEVYSPDVFSSSFLKLGNQYFLMVQKRVDNVDFVALAFIKHQYDVESEYLKDSFVKGFPDQNNDRISTSIFSDYRIYDPAGHFLFSVEKSWPPIIPPWQQWVVFFLFLSFIIGLYRLLEGLAEYFLIHLGLYRGLLLAAVFFAMARLFFSVGTIPEILQRHEIFSPILYSSGFLAPSLGHSILNVLWFFLFAVFLWQKQSLFVAQSQDRRLTTIHLIFWVIFSALIVNHLNLFIRNIVFDSTISTEMFRVAELSVYSFLAVFLVLAYMAVYVLVVSFGYFLFQSKFAHKTIFFSQTIGAVIIFFIFLISIPVVFLWVVLFYVLINYLIFLYFRNKITKYTLASFLAALTAVFLIVQSSYYTEKKWVETRKVFAYQLAFSDDLKTNIQLEKISAHIPHDTVLSRLISENKGDFVRASNYLSSQYFTGLFRNYNVTLQFFKPNDSLFVDTSVTQWQAWSAFYQHLVTTWGSPVENSSFYRINRSSGYLRFVGIHSLELLNLPYSLIVEIETKPLDLHQGIHSYILKDRFGFSNLKENLSYAFYFRDRLISKTGKYDFKMTMPSDFSNLKSNPQFFSDASYRFIVFRFSPDQVVLLVEPKPKFFDFLIWFSYVFIIYYLTVALISLLLIRGVLSSYFSLTLRHRIQFYMSVGLMLAIVIIGSGSIYFNFRSSKQKYLETINEKIVSVSTEISRYFMKVSDLHKYDDNYVHFLLRHYSTVFNTDITMYDAAGSLVATSRRELFEEQIVGSKMNYSAFFQLSQQNESRILIVEQIGVLPYYSAYVPLLNSYGKSIGYLNLPFFTHDMAYSAELTSVLVALVNISVLLLLISMVISFVIAKMVTEPLHVIRTSLQRFDITKQNAPIHYPRKDEIGDLVREYNRMVEELMEKTSMLAQTERQSAWQTMARQVAHEIKNPLTPMRLNIQLLQKAWDDKVPDFDSRMKKVCRTLIEQIDTLSEISNEFSNFAKMPAEKVETLNLEELVRSSIQLFEHTKNVQFRFENQCPYEPIVRGDRNQMLRVFTNLFKNAVQAIPEDRLGLVEVKIYPEGSNIVVSITDNGEGIPEEMQKKIFQPNFTTKSSGMGLGLAMVKNIVSAMSGTIWFETEPNRGTTFFIRFPVE